MIYGKKLIPIGVENFASIRVDNNYYVDKTQMIYDLVHDTKNAVTLSLVRVDLVKR